MPHLPALTDADLLRCDRDGLLFGEELSGEETRRDVLAFVLRAA